MKPDFKLQILLLFVIELFVIASCKTDKSNWPQFRGPENNMIVSGSLPESWNDSMNIKWSVPLTGTGWSSPIVYGDKIFITTSVIEQEAPKPETTQQPNNSPVNTKIGQQVPPPPPPVDDTTFMKEVWRWELTCFDANTGKEMWKQVARKGNPSIKKHAGTSYASETPVTDGNIVIAYFGMHGVYCYDFTGKLLWENDLGAYKTLNGWGTGSSPVIWKNIVYVLVDNEEKSFLVALDANTGNEKWRTDRDEKTTYSTPVIWHNKLRTELVTNGKTARSYDPLTGKLFWELKMNGEMAVPSPVYDKEHVYVGIAGRTGKKGTIYAVKSGAEGDITPIDSSLTSDGVSWSLPGGGPANPSPLLYNGYIYLLSGRGGELSCIDAGTGKQVYFNKIENVSACWAAPWICNDKLYFYDEKGITQVIQPGKEFKVLAKNTLDDKFWASPATSGNSYIIRGVEKLYCISSK